MSRSKTEEGDGPLVPSPALVFDPSAERTTSYGRRAARARTRGRALSSFEGGTGGRNRAEARRSAQASASGKGAWRVGWRPTPRLGASEQRRAGPREPSDRRRRGRPGEARRPNGGEARPATSTPIDRDRSPNAGRRSGASPRKGRSSAHRCDEPCSEPSSPSTVRRARVLMKATRRVSSGVVSAADHVGRSISHNRFIILPQARSRPRGRGQSSRFLTPKSANGFAGQFAGDGENTMSAEAEIQRAERFGPLASMAGVAGGL